jgi:hypothetical protein
MEKNLKAGAAKASATALTNSPKAKPATFFAPRMLTPSEIEWLKRDLKQSLEIARAIKV